MDDSISDLSGNIGQQIIPNGNCIEEMKTEKLKDIHESNLYFIQNMRCLHN